MSPGPLCGLIGEGQAEARPGGRAANYAEAGTTPGRMRVAALISVSCARAWAGRVSQAGALPSDVGSRDAATARAGIVAG